mgnify:CR=1 FL=1
MQERVNPIVVEIIRNAINSAAREMNSCLIRSAFGPGIFEMKDCSVGIFDRDARLLGQSSGLPIFLGNLEICIQIVTEKIGLGGYQPGDVFIMETTHIFREPMQQISQCLRLYFTKASWKGFQQSEQLCMIWEGKIPLEMQIPQKFIRKA